jgi:large subunit ribosomal protein L28
VRTRSSSTDIQEFHVAANCDVCGKGPGFGMSVSHSHRRTRRRWNPNIQTMRVAAGGGNTKKVNACISCIKANKVVPAVR